MKSLFQLQHSLFLISIFFSSIVAAAEVICPPKEAYEPYCSCYGYQDSITSAAYISLNCMYQYLGDDKVSDILDAFLLRTPPVSPVWTVSLEGNRLTRVPAQIPLFPQLRTVALYGNDIKSLEKGAFYLSYSNPASQHSYFVTFGDNQLRTIAPGAFQGMIFLVFYARLGNIKIKLIKCFQLPFIPFLYDYYLITRKWLRQQYYVLFKQ